MSIADKIAINTRYTRSINLERDAGSSELTESYVITSSPLRALEQMATTFHEEQAPRAWSLVGPYGAGKSAFSVFLTQLLSPQLNPASGVAEKMLRAEQSALAAKYKKQKQDGYFEILLTGSPEPLSKSLLQAVLTSAQAYWPKKKPEAWLKQLRSDLDKKRVSVSKVMDHIKTLQNKLARKHCGGVLIVIDELGKFLEYEARHEGNDIYLLQALAEHACRGGKPNLALVVLLHQSLDRYAAHLKESDRNEWIKVQGRFEEIPFIDSAEQSVKVIGRALQQKLSPAERKKLKTEKIVDALLKEEALPRSLGRQNAVELFGSCYPLHPVSAILLPLLCQKIAQNERSLFSYLGSSEENGFLKVLEHLEKVGDYVLPDHIYDYFIANQSIASGDHITRRRWAEVASAIDRLGDAPPEEVTLTKVIGILNIIGAKGNLKPSKKVLQSCGLPNLNKSINALTEKSIISYRRFGKEYRVWQGSDFDIDDALQEAEGQLMHLSVAEELNNRGYQPIIARQYSIQKGTLRYFVPAFIDAESYLSTETEASQERILFYLARNEDDKVTFKKTVKKHFGDRDIVVLCPRGEHITTTVVHTAALKKIISSNQELHNDPVAKKEIEDRLIIAENAETEALDKVLADFELNEWYNAGKKISIESRRHLQKALSSLLGRIYTSAPVIHNELINTNYPSSQATAARTKLLLAMLESPEKQNLGIDKYPPEKAIYQAVFQKSKLHKKDTKGNYGFVEPPKGKQDTANIQPVWQRINQFLDSTEEQAKSFANLNQELRSPPYGVKAGLLPLLYIAAYIIYQRELAFYCEGRYVPILTEKDITHFLKRPDEYTVQRFRIEGINASILEQYQKALFKKPSKRTVIELIQPLATFIQGLPQFVQKTKMTSLLTKDAMKVRDALNSAASPEELLFKQLPKALGISSQGKAEGLADKLTEALRSLKYAYPTLLKNQRELLCNAFGLTPEKSLPDIRSHFAWFNELTKYTIEKDGLKAFINRLSEKEVDDDQWLENVLSFLGQLPTKQWTDETISVAEFKLADYAKRSLELQRLYISYVEQGNKNPASIEAAKQELQRMLRKHTLSEVLMAIAQILDERQEPTNPLQLAVNKETGTTNE